MHQTSYQSMRSIIALFVSFALVWTSACPVGVAYADEVPVDDNEHIAVQDAGEEVEVADKTDGDADAVTDDRDPEAAIGAQADPAPSSDSQINDIIAHMRLDEKISQMIIPAIRTWDGKDNKVQSLEGLDDLKAALQKHQYGGIILFGQNISSVEQLGTLVNQLQENNMTATGRSKNVPYFMAVDEEGGVVTRFTMGTRMNGNMAIGATGANAEQNALATGGVLGTECKALGFNMNFAPTIDVNSNPSNPAIGTRSFSDDPNVVATLGNQFIAGLTNTGVIATLKHFPGHGDTGADTHIDTAAVLKTLDELNQCELVPFRSAVANGAEMIMTAHVTLPKYDDEVTFADGTKGYYPATMSHKVITDLLRGDLNYKGVVVTDAIEMDALHKAKLVPGEPGSAEYVANLSEKIINAGVDLLLIPTDLDSAGKVTFYDNYITAIANKVGDDAGKTIPTARIDESVARILELKKNHGFLDKYTPVDIESAKATVGSEENHATEMAIARQAVTLVKNDDHTLPLSGHENHIVFMGRMNFDNATISYAIDELKRQNIIDADAYVNNLVTGKTEGDPWSATNITIDYYYDSAKGALHYTNDLQSAIANADTVIALTASYGSGPLQPTSPLYQGVARAIAETHAAGGRFVLMANNLPYDAARYQDADAIMLSYMSAGLDTDPTSRKDGSANMLAYNANVTAAVQSLFDEVAPTGKLPVAIPPIEEVSPTTVAFANGETLYERGHGLTYDYVFVEGAGGTHVKGSGQDLDFKNNARFDKFKRVEVDGRRLSPSQYTINWGSTNISLGNAFLNGLAAGTHALDAIYDYGQGEFAVSTTFSVLDTPVASVSYQAHVQRYGWKKPVADGAIGGTTGKGKRLEALRLNVSNLPCAGGIRYRAHVQGKGWQNGWSMDGETSGTTGKGKRIEAVQIKLYGELADQYDVYYRVHAQKCGWMAWAKNGEKAGTQGLARRAEAVQVVLVKKGSPAPGKTFHDVTQAYKKAFLKK